jgi:hypothetical protein
MKLKTAALVSACMPTLFCFTTIVSAVTGEFSPHSLPMATMQDELPTFADYPAKGKLTGKPAKAKIRTKEARMYRTAITEGAKEGPNFAGHFTIVQWGCGTGCLGFAIVDANTGNVFTPPFYVGFGYDLDTTLRDRELLEYRLGSRLLIVTGMTNEKDQGQYFYEWDGKRLKLVRTEYEIKG